MAQVYGLGEAGGRGRLGDWQEVLRSELLALDNSPKFAKPDDVAGAIEAIESVGWKLEHVGYVNVSGAGQATGVFDSAALKVRGFYLFRRPADDA